MIWRLIMFQIIAYTRAVNQIMMSSHSNNFNFFLRGGGQNAYSAPSIIIFLGGGAAAPAAPHFSRPCRPRIYNWMHVWINGWQTIKHIEYKLIY